MTNKLPKKRFVSKLPISILGLGLVSMFMDISSELVHSLLPVFMATVLGTSIVTIGVIEGLAEGTAAIMKAFSGAISDYFRKRKLLTIIGYSLSAFTKLIFPVATTIEWVFGARFVDRIGKGIRGAPRDALIADIVPVELRGAAFGLRQSLDSLGAFIGPLLAFVFMIWFNNDIRAVLWVAVLPALITVLLLITLVHEPKNPEHDSASRKRLRLADAKRLPMWYWYVVALGAIFSLARFSEAFLILRAQDVGLSIGYVPIILIVMNIIYAIFAYPAGEASDRFSARILLVFGLMILIVADIVLAIAVSPWITLIGAAFWGLHMAFTQGLLSKLVADTAPADLRGTAFGVFNLVSGVALFLASFIAGTLWTLFGAAATFITGAFFALIAAMGLFFYRPKTQFCKPTV